MTWNRTNKANIERRNADLIKDYHNSKYSDKSRKVMALAEKYYLTVQQVKSILKLSKIP